MREKRQNRERKKNVKKKEQIQIQSENNNERANSFNTLLVRQAAMTLNSFDVECHFSAFLSN